MLEYFIGTANDTVNTSHGPKYGFLPDPALGEPIAKTPSGLDKFWIIKSNNQAVYEEFAYDNQFIYHLKDTSWATGPNQDVMCNSGAPAGFTMLEGCPATGNDIGTPVEGIPWTPRCVSDGEELSTPAFEVVGFDKTNCEACAAPFTTDGGGSVDCTGRQIKVHIEDVTFPSGISISNAVRIEILSGPGTGENYWYSKEHGWVGFGWLTNPSGYPTDFGPPMEACLTPDPTSGGSFACQPFNGFYGDSNSGRDFEIYGPQQCKLAEELNVLSTRPFPCATCLNYVPEPTISCAGNITYTRNLKYTSFNTASCDLEQCRVNQETCQLEYGDTPIIDQPGVTPENELIVGPVPWKGRFTLLAEPVIQPYAGNDNEESREKYIADYIDGALFYKTPINPASSVPALRYDPKVIYNPNATSYFDLDPRDPRFFSYTGIIPKLAPQEYLDELKHELLDRVNSAGYSGRILPIHDYTIGYTWGGSDTTTLSQYNLDRNRRKPLRRDYESPEDYQNALDQWEEINWRWANLWTYVPVASRDDTPGRFNPIPQNPAVIVPLSRPGGSGGPSNPGGPGGPGGPSGPGTPLADLGSEIDEFFAAGAAGYLAWQYSGDRGFGEEFASDPYAFFRNRDPGPDICATLASRSGGSQFIGVNMWDAGDARHSRDKLIEHFDYLKSQCGVTVVRTFAKAGGAAGARKIVEAAASAGIRAMISIGDYSNGGAPGLPSGVGSDWFTSGYASQFKAFAQEVVNQTGGHPGLYGYEIANEIHCRGDDNALDGYTNIMGSDIASILRSGSSNVGFGQKASENTTRCDSPGGTTASSGQSHFEYSNSISQITMTSGHFYNQAEKALALQALQQSRGLGKPYYVGEAPAASRSGVSSLNTNSQYTYNFQIPNDQQFASILPFSTDTYQISQSNQDLNAVPESPLLDDGDEGSYVYQAYPPPIDNNTVLDIEEVNGQDDYQLQFPHLARLYESAHIMYDLLAPYDPKRTRNPYSSQPNTNPPVPPIGPIINPTQVRAFPSAQGFGMDATGGRGGRVILVRNLSDTTGSGSLRDCVQAAGPRTCVFLVGGTIEVNSTLRISNGNITIAGQTAPGGGITIRNAPGSDSLIPLSVDADNVIIRYLSLRPGPGGDTDAFRINSVSNVIADHISTSWATDENISIIDSANTITIQQSIIAQGLNNSTHSNGAHSKGLLINGNNNSGNITLINNLFAHNLDRNPEVQSNRTVDIINNIIFNYGNAQPTYITYTSGFKPDTKVNFIGNVTIPGISSPDAPALILRDGSSDQVQIYAYDNQAPGEILDSVAQLQTSADSIGLSTVNIQNSNQTQSYVLTHVGNNRRLNCTGQFIDKRDIIDSTFVNEVRTRGGTIIDSVASWPTISGGTPCADTDNDGIFDQWETTHFTSLTDVGNLSDTSQDTDGDGYTDFEEFINGSDPNAITRSTGQETALNSTELPSQLQAFTNISPTPILMASSEIFSPEQTTQLAIRTPVKSIETYQIAQNVPSQCDPSNTGRPPGCYPSSGNGDGEGCFSVEIKIDPEVSADGRLNFCVTARQTCTTAGNIGDCDWYFNGGELNDRSIINDSDKDNTTICSYYNVGPNGMPPLNGTPGGPYSVSGFIRCERDINQGCCNQYQYASCNYTVNSDKSVTSDCQSVAAPPAPPAPICAPTELTSVPQCSGTIRSDVGDNLCGQSSFDLIIGPPAETFWNLNANNSVAIDQDGNVTEGDGVDPFSSPMCGAAVACEEGACICDTAAPTNNKEFTGNCEITYACLSDGRRDLDECPADCGACVEQDRDCETKCCGPDSTGFDDCRTPKNAAPNICSDDAAPNCGPATSPACVALPYGSELNNTPQNITGSRNLSQYYQSLTYPASREIHLQTEVPYLGTIFQELVGFPSESSSYDNGVHPIFRSMTPYRSNSTAPDNVPWHLFHSGDASGDLTIRNLGPAEDTNINGGQTLTQPFFFPFLGAIQDATQFVRDCLTAPWPNGCSNPNYTAQDEPQDIPLNFDPPTSGECLETSDPFAVMGNSGAPGCSTGAHLHFGVYEGGVRKNPAFYLDPTNSPVGSTGLSMPAGTGSVAQWRWPMNARVTLTQYYGPCVGVACRYYTFHTGLDMVGSPDTTIYAVQPGIVTFHALSCSGSTLYIARLHHINGSCTDITDPNNVPSSAYNGYVTEYQHIQNPF